MYAYAFPYSKKSNVQNSLSLGQGLRSWNACSTLLTAIYCSNPAIVWQHHWKLLGASRSSFGSCVLHHGSKVQRWRLNWVALRMLRKFSLRVRHNYVGDLVLLILNVSEPGPHLRKMVGALTRHGFQTLSPTLSAARLLRSPRVGPMSEVQQVPRTQRTSVTNVKEGVEPERVGLRKLRCCLLMFIVIIVHVKHQFVNAQLCAFESKNGVCAVLRYRGSSFQYVSETKPLHTSKKTHLECAASFVFWNRAIHA